MEKHGDIKFQKLAILVEYLKNKILRELCDLEIVYRHKGMVFLLFKFRS